MKWFMVLWGQVFLLILFVTSAAFPFDFLAFSKDTLVKCVHPKAHINNARVQYLQEPQEDEYNTSAIVQVDYTGIQSQNSMTFKIIHSYDHVKITLLTSTVPPLSSCPYLSGEWQYIGSDNSQFPRNFREAKISFDLARYKQTIHAYEMFLAAQYDIPELNQEAIHQIYELTKLADLVEGYQYFLQKYPNTPEAQQASQRLYEIAYMIAEEENTLISYHGFLSTFKAAPLELREQAFTKAMNIEEGQLLHEIREDSQAQVDELYRQHLLEKLGRREYEEAIAAKNAGDHETFIQKYHTILYSQLFAQSEVRFDVLRDQELVKAVEEIKEQLRIIQHDIEKSRETLLGTIGSLQKAIEEGIKSDDKYMQEILVMLQQQRQILQGQPLPTEWDLNKSPWLNYMYLGVEVTKILLQSAKYLN